MYYIRVKPQIEKHSTFSFDAGDRRRSVDQASLDKRKLTQSSCSLGRLDANTIPTGADFTIGGSARITSIKRSDSSSNSDEDDVAGGTAMAIKGSGNERTVTWAEPRITVIPPTSTGRSVLMAMHSEYTRYQVLRLL